MRRGDAGYCASAAPARPSGPRQAARATRANAKLRRINGSLRRCTTGSFAGWYAQSHGKFRLGRRTLAVCTRNRLRSWLVAARLVVKDPNKLIEREQVEGVMRHGLPPRPTGGLH